MSKEREFFRLISQPLRRTTVTLAADGNFWWLRGTMPIGHKSALLDIFFDRWFKNLKRHAPLVYCDEKWVRRDIDWHVFSDGCLCWTLPRLWRDLHCWRGKPRRLIAVEGSELLIESVRSLLTRHLLGTMQNKGEWPNAWGQWSHGREGANEYERERKLWRNAR